MTALKRELHFILTNMV